MNTSNCSVRPPTPSLYNACLGIHALLLLLQTSRHVIDRDIHPNCRFLCRQSLLHEAEDDRVKLLPDLDDMPVRVIEPDDALAPTVLKQRMYIADIKLFHMLAEGVHSQV